MSLIMMSNISFSQNNWRVKNTELTGHWQIQSSDKVKANDEEISTLKFHPQNWYAAKVPNSTLGSLVDAGVFKNVFYNRNLEKITDSLFKAPWWYRRTFNI
jgi:exo-1,4-beta-D-glucosaminidase